MAAVTITAGNVALSDTGQTYLVGTLGGTVTQGQVVRVNNGAYVAANNTTSADADCAGVAITKGDSGDACLIVTKGKIAAGGTLTLGQEYYVGNSAGTYGPQSDVTAGDYISAIGIAVSTNELYVLPYASGVVAT